MKKRMSTVILLLLFFVGLCVMLYPALADYWNSKTQSEAIVDYEAMLENIPTEDFSAYFAAAQAYNQSLAAFDDPLIQYSQLGDYFEILNLSGTGMMGFITIEKIGQELPVYHGTSDSVLSTAAGHLQGTSLPVGGESTHCVVSAHRGLPTAELFTYLDRLEIGDTFYLTVLDRVLTYEVDQIRIVEPNDTGYLSIEAGEDYCTLLTCTPYGVNTQRLLVRGKRIDAAQHQTIHVTAQAYRVDTLIVMPIVALPMLAVLMLYVVLAPAEKESTGEELL